MNIKENFSSIGAAALIYSYAVLHGSAYLLGFWSQINFNIFPYLSLSDFVKATIPNLFFLWLAPLFSMVAWFDDNEDPKKNYKKIAVVAIFTLLGITILRIFEAFELFQQTGHVKKGNKIESETIFTMILLVVSLISFSFKKKKDFTYLLFVIFSLQLISVVIGGYIDGKNTYNGNYGVKYLKYKKICSSIEDDEWIYAGYFSEKVFFINKDNKEICIRKADNFKIS